MKAIRMHRLCGPEALGIDEVPLPRPQDDEVVVKVRAASVNPVDWKMRSGKIGLKMEQLPVVLDREVSGAVEICGTRALTAEEGDPIYAMLGRGGYAEYALVSRSKAPPNPGALIMSMPLQSRLQRCVWQGLFDHGGLKAGQRVLIHGGVGHFAIQFAKTKCAFVATTVSAVDIDFVRKFGADQPIDYKAERFDDVVRNSFCNRSGLVRLFS